MKTEDILNEREETHGSFGFVAMLSQRLKGCISSIQHVFEMDDEVGCDEYENRLNEKQQEALDAICGKIARIVCGDPNYADHWDDIAGYAMLGKSDSKDQAQEREKDKAVPNEVEEPSLSKFDSSGKSGSDSIEIDYICEICHGEINIEKKFCGYVEAGSTKYVHIKCSRKFSLNIEDEIDKNLIMHESKCCGNHTNSDHTKSWLDYTCTRCGYNLRE